MYRKYLTNEKMSMALFVFIFVLYAITYMTKNCYSAAMSAIVHEGVMTKSQTGLMSAIFYLVYAPLQIVGGKMADKYSPGKIIFIGMLGSAVSNLIIFLNQNYYLMIVVWTFNAIVQFGVWPSVFKIMSSVLAKCHRTKAIYYISFSSTLGLLFAYGSAMFMNKWQNNFLLSAILLFILAFLIIIVYPYMERHMEELPLPDNGDFAKENSKDKAASKKEGRRMFLKSGLYATCIVIVFRCIVEQGAKNLSPTMLMESYEAVSPVIGNFFSLFIITAGLLGIWLSRFLCPRYIKNEIVSFIVLLGASLPFLIVILFIGNVHTVFVVVSLSMVAMLTSGTHLLTSYISVKFAKYGKNGEAAGILNAAASIGIVIQSYGLTFIADHLGWIAVAWFWLALIVVSIIMLLFIYPKWKKFISE